MNNALTKTLASGLVHGLNVGLPENREPQEVTKLSKDAVCLGVNTKCIEMWYKTQSVLPYLRPPSDLTKEIEHKGERFVPIDFFEVTDDHDTCPIEQDHGNIKLIKTLKGIAEYNVSFDVKFLPSWVVDKLCSWHFNVNDLSPDKFIEVTEELNPYK